MNADRRRIHIEYGFCSLEDDHNIFYCKMNETGNSFGSNPASLKGKLQTLEVRSFRFSNKSKTSRTNSTTTRRRCRSWGARRTPSSQCWPWKLQTWRRASPTSWFASRKKCKSETYSGSATLISRRQRTAGSSSRSLPSREKKLLFSSSSSACSAESPN